MIQLLDEAISQVQQLPAIGQGAIAQLILDERADEQQGEADFARFQDALSRLAAKVRADIRPGKTRSIGMDEV